MSVSLDHEVFALRDNEQFAVQEGRPIKGRWIAVMLRSVQLPEGPHVATRHCDGEPVEKCAVLAAEMNATRQAWQWMQIAAPSKERIGDLLLEASAERDRWYYLVITDLSLEAC